MCRELKHQQDTLRVYIVERIERPRERRANEMLPGRGGVRRSTSSLTDCRLLPVRSSPGKISGRWTRSIQFRHFKHCMAEFFMGKFTVNLPALTLIELNGPSI